MKKTTIIAVMVCAAMAVAALIGCSSGSSSVAGTSGSASASAGASASSESASTGSSAAAGSAKFVGTWKIAAVEQQGITIGGNFGQYSELGSNGVMELKEDGTGTVAFSDEPTALSWAENSEDSIFVTPQSDTGYTKQEALEVVYKDDALFFPIEDKGQEGYAIFTHDGMYAGARQISAEDAQPITSESDLLGTWKLTGMNMGGISFYGDADALGSMLANGEATVTFKEGGVVEMSAGSGTWTVNADGASMTSPGLTGEDTCSILKLGDEILLDFTEAYKGMEMIEVFVKA